MYWAFRYRYDLWARWNYLLGAAFDAGFNFNMLLIFLFFGPGKIVTMPTQCVKEIIKLINLIKNQIMII
jgi:hypothetical protein